jgi:hypothetical protein
MMLGTVITSAVKLGPHAIEITFASSWSGHHQLYLGRRLANSSSLKADRVLTAQIDPGDTPPPIQVIAVTDTELDTEFGSSLPTRPYNLHTLNWSAAGIEADTDRFRITTATAIDTNPTEFLAAVEYTVGINLYDFETPAIAASGSWRFGITPFDSSCGDYSDEKGNEGTEALATITADVYPPDIAPQSDRQRFALSATGGTLTVDFDYQT